MSTNPTSFRLPSIFNIPDFLELEGKKIPFPRAINDNLRLALNGLLDAHQAINALNTKLNTLQAGTATATAAATTATASSAGVEAVTPWYVIYWFNGQGVSPSGSQIILRHQIAGSGQASPQTVLTFPINFAGSQGGCITAPTGNVTFNINQNGTNIGTMSIAAGQTTATFSLSTQAFFNAGDILDFVMQVASDATLAGVFFTLVGTRLS